MSMPMRSSRHRPRCVFRVAAGPRVGYGHLMRARALARCLDMEVSISVRGGRTAKAAARVVGPLVNDADPLHAADVLIVDDPRQASGGSWVSRARRLGIHSVSVHDEEWAHDADLVVCGALGVSRPQTTARALHGVRFYLLDSRIAEARALRADRRGLNPPHVIIALGGGQHERRVAQRLVDAIVAKCPDAVIEVAAGFSASARPLLRQASWLTARTGLTQALLGADVAVVAGGVTIYEACALGVPSVGLAVVPGQRRSVRAFAREGAVIDAGDATSGQAAIALAASGVARLVRDGQMRRSLGSRARALVDGRGAHRVARSIHALVEEGRRRYA